MDDNYFNFPIVLIQGFMNDTRKCLTDIFDYCIYEFSKGNSDEETRAFFRIASYGNKEKTMNHGKELYFRIKNEAYTGLAVSLFWQYYNDYKTDLDKITLLAFLAIKSIVGNRVCCKVTNQNLIYCRMAGFTNIQKLLPKEIAEYCTRWKFEKIKTDLKEYYNVSFYAYHTRGQYISTKVDFKTLCRIAEEQKMKGRMARQRKSEKEAREQVRNDLLNNST